MIKFYNPLGKVCMTNEYFAGLVGAAAQSCYGVCGMATGAIMIVFGLCMLAFYTPTEISEFYSSSHQAFGSSGATAAQVLKAGFSMLLIGLGATDICAFGSKLFKRHDCKRDER